MPSRAELRVVAERVLRGIVIVILFGLLIQSLRKQREAGNPDVGVRGLATLSDWSRLSSAPGRILVQLDTVPSALERAWLRALAGSGSTVTWSGNLPALMIGAQPVASPTGGIRARIAAPSGSAVVMSDDVGVLDTVKSASAGAALALSSAAGSVTARVNGSVASTIPRDSVVLHKVLVIGDAGWESKFVVAALEEEGWKVDAFIRVAPDVDVTQGSAAVIDTSRYSAVVALDGASSSYADRIIEFVRSGGGVVLSPQAAALDALAPLRSGAAGRAASEARTIQASGSVNLATLALAPITSLRSDAIALEKRGAAVAIAARRIGAGRALQFGFEDTWRWRMGGSEGAVRDHRVWWTGLVSSVAYAPRVPRVVAATAVDEAPMASLVAAIGPRVDESTGANLTESSPPWMVWLFILLSLAVLAEVVSRRLRGAP
jgi:hypothetical protein